jgi:hypothetical protein
MKSPRNTQIQKTIKTEWTQNWKQGKDNARKLCHLYNRPHTSNGAKIYQSINNRKHMAWIARLLTGHCSLNKYLRRFNKIDEMTCECGEGEETVKHYLLLCELYDSQRDKLRRVVGAGGMRVEELLGSIKMILDTIKFIEDNKRFEF